MEFAPGQGVSHHEGTWEGVLRSPSSTSCLPQEVSAGSVRALIGPSSGADHLPALRPAENGNWGD
jgi:hypothetical protein